MLLTIVLKKTEQLSARVSALAKELLALEKRKTQESEGEIVERCLLACLKSDEALEVIRKYAKEDPTVAAILAAFRSPTTATRGRKKSN